MTSWKETRWARFLLNALVGLLAGALIAYFIANLGPLGHRIYSTQLISDYFVALLWGLGIALALMGMPVSVQERKDLVLLWAARCGVTLFAMLFYENHYGLDAYMYHYASIQREFDWSQVKFGAGTQNTQALAWILNEYLPIFDSYHALKVCFSFVGFMGTYTIYRGFVALLGRESRLLLFVLGLFPSMIFWSSILGKDPVILLGIGIYVFGTLRLMSGNGLGSVLWIACGICLAAAFRSWYFAILVLPLASLGIRGIERPALRYGLIALVGGAAVYSLQMFADQFQLDSVEHLVSHTQSVSRSWAYGGSGNTAPEFSSIGGILKFAPLGMFTALLRPLPGEVMNPFGLLAGFENLFLLFVIAKCVTLYRVEPERFKHPVILWSITLILVWSLIYGFVSYQNLGSASRFRLQILPVMLCLCYFLLEEKIRAMADKR